MPAPTATNLDQSLSFLEDHNPLLLNDIVVTDADANEIITATLTLSQPAAGSLTTSGAATYNPQTGVWSITGTVAEVNAALADVSVVFAIDWEESVSITTRIRDAGGQGPPDGHITLTGTGVNDAPMVTGPADIDVVQDVASAITGISFSDVDADPDAVVVTFSVPAGSLQAVNGGGVTVGGTASALTLTGTLSDINAFVAGGNLSYLTAGGATGSVNLTVQINDGGFNGTGGPLTDSQVVALDILATNRAPVLDNSGAPRFADINEDVGPPVNGSTAGSVLVSSLLGGATDADGDPLGAAFQSVDSGVTLWYSLDGGATWVQAPAVSATAALLLDGAARVYLEPDANLYANYPAVFYRAWDQTAGVSGGTGSIAVTGGSTAFSAASEAASVRIVSVNDAPQISGSNAISLVLGESQTLTGIGFSDPDNATMLTVTFSVSSGHLEGAAFSGVSVAGSGTATVTVVGTAASVSGFIANGSLKHVANSAGDVVLTVNADDGATGGGGSAIGGPLSATKAITLHVAPPEAVGKPQPPPQEGKVIDGAEVRVRDTAQGGQVIREIEIPAIAPNRPDSVGDSHSAQIPLDLLERIQALIPTGMGMTVTTPVAPPMPSALLQTLQLGLGAPSGIVDTKTFADRLEHIAGANPDAPTSVASIVLTAIDQLRDQSARLILEAAPPGAGGGPAVVLIETMRNAIAESIQDAIEIALQNITLAVIHGSARLTGGLGPQIVFGDGAAQSMILGEGDDELHGGGGDDIVGSAGGNDTLAGDDGRDTVFGGDGQDQLTGGTGADNLHGNLGSDIVHGGEGADTIHGGQGDDAISGGKDDDIAFGDLGNDVLYGDLGSDQLSGGEGADLVHGNLGDDTVDGGAGADVLHGGQGADSLAGGEGADILAGDMGDDVLVGGAGADLFFVSGAGGTDRILDFDAAAGDRLRLDSGLSYTLRQVGGDTVVDLGPGQTVVLEGVQLAGLPEGWIVGA